MGNAPHALQGLYGLDPVTSVIATLVIFGSVHAGLVFGFKMEPDAGTGALTMILGAVVMAAVFGTWQ